MKKKILGGLALLAIAAVAAWNVNFNSHKNLISDVALTNVEALAQESGYCPNGCLDNGDGCWCNGWHPCYL